MFAISNSVVCHDLSFQSRCVHLILVEYLGNRKRLELGFSEGFFFFFLNLKFSSFGRCDVWVNYNNSWIRSRAHFAIILKGCTNNVAFIKRQHLQAFSTWNVRAIRREMFLTILFKSISGLRKDSAQWNWIWLCRIAAASQTAFPPR